MSLNETVETFEISLAFDWKEFRFWITKIVIRTVKKQPKSKVTRINFFDAMEILTTKDKLIKKNF